MDLDRAGQDRLLAEVCDLVDDQGGVWSSVEARLRERYPDEDDLEDALTMALVPLYAYRVRGGPEVSAGPEFVRQMRDELVASAEPQAPSRRWVRRRAS
jgi:hypothetical protein